MLKKGAPMLPPCYPTKKNTTFAFAYTQTAVFLYASGRLRIGKRLTSAAKYADASRLPPRGTAGAALGQHWGSFFSHCAPRNILAVR